LILSSFEVVCAFDAATRGRWRAAKKKKKKMTQGWVVNGESPR
jgi:hypothetical protein